MSFTPTLTEQTVSASRRREATQRLDRMELRSEIVVAVGFAAACVVVALFSPRQPLHLLPAIVSCLIFIVAARVRFETPFGYTAAMQLGFVPLLFAVPVGILAPACAVCNMLSLLPDVLHGRIAVVRLLKSAGNSWFAIGPAAVIAIAGTPARNANLALLALALLAQFSVDSAASTARELMARRSDSVRMTQDLWVYMIDAALACIGLLAAIGLKYSPFAPLALLPLLWLLNMFAQERSGRLESLIELNETYRGTAQVLGKVIDADDAYTGEHCRSVVDLCLAVADRLGLDEDRTHNLEFGAMLHDIGKIEIPQEVLNKPGKLNEEEWAIMQTHTIAGQRILDTVGGFMCEVGVIVRAHHERFDGGGYPDGLAGERIPLEARIIAVCDTWNAMRTDRIYRKALSFDAAYAELRRVSGTQLDPEIVDSLLAIVRRPVEPSGAQPSAFGRPSLALVVK